MGFVLRLHVPLFALKHMAPMDLEYGGGGEDIFGISLSHGECHALNLFVKQHIIEACKLGATRDMATHLF